VYGKILEDSWPVSMKIALRIKKWPTTILSSLGLFFSTQALLKNRGHMLTLKFGKSRLRLGRPVRPGPQGGQTGVRCSRSGT
jgi:hypothetical protein